TVKPDSAKADSDHKVKYYVFDEEDANSDESERKRKIQRNKEQTKTKKENLIPDFAAIDPTGPKNTKPIWSADQITAKLGWDPVFKFNMLFESGFKDLQ